MQLKRSGSFSKTNVPGSYICYIKQNKTKLKTKIKDAPRTTYSIWSNKNIAYKKMICCFVDEEGMPWASPSFDTCTSWICIGVQGIPKLEIFSIIHLITSFFSPYTWKLPSYKISHNSLLAALVQIK